MSDKITPAGHGAAEYNVTYHLNEARQWLEQLTDAQRIEAFALLVDGFCYYCGSEKRGICHCTNDE